MTNKELQNYLYLYFKPQNNVPLQYVAAAAMLDCDWLDLLPSQVPLNSGPLLGKILIFQSNTYKNSVVSVVISYLQERDFQNSLRPLKFVTWLGHFSLYSSVIFKENKCEYVEEENSSFLIYGRHKEANFGYCALI